MKSRPLDLMAAQVLSIFLHDALVHARFRHVLADRSLVVAAPEISGERLLADDVFSRLHGLDDHRGMQRGWRADIDDVDLRVGEQVLEIAIGSRDLMLLGEIEHVVAARGNRRHLRIEPIDPPIGVHVQLGDKAASDKANSDLRHRRAPSRESSSYCLRSCAKAPGGAVRLRSRWLVRIVAPTPFAASPEKYD